MIVLHAELITAMPVFLVWFQVYFRAANAPKISSKHADKDIRRTHNMPFLELTLRLYYWFISLAHSYLSILLLQYKPSGAHTAGIIIKWFFNNAKSKPTVQTYHSLLNSSPEDKM